MKNLYIVIVQYKREHVVYTVCWNVYMHTINNILKCQSNLSDADTSIIWWISVVSLSAECMEADLLSSNFTNCKKKPYGIEIKISLSYYKPVNQEEVMILYSCGMWCRRGSLSLVINCGHVAISCAVHEGRPADSDWLPQLICSRQSSLWFYVRRLCLALWETAPSVMLLSPYLPLSWPSVNIHQVRGRERGGDARWCWNLSCRAAGCLLSFFSGSLLLQRNLLYKRSLNFTFL